MNPTEESLVSLCCVAHLYCRMHSIFIDM